MDRSGLVLSHERDVYTITLDRPDVLNAWTPDMWESFASMLAEINADDDARVLLLRARGRAFSSGGDVNVMAERLGQASIEAMTTYVEGVQRVSARLVELRVPTVAIVTGVAVGAGCNLTLACDVRIATPAAAFGQVFIKRGLCVDQGGSYLLPRIVGIGRALEMIYTGRVVEADEALSIGLVSEVVEEDALEMRVAELVELLTSHSGFALQISKRLVYGGLNCDFHSALEQEAIGQAACFLSTGHREGVEAFFARTGSQTA